VYLIAGYVVTKITLSGGKIDSLGNFYYVQLRLFMKRVYRFLLDRSGLTAT